MIKSITFTLILVALIPQICSHGMMLVPPNRSSLWRLNKTAPVNYNDNQNFCGGASIQWGQFGGKCGPCGDVYSDPHPQDNENTGKYGQGIVVAEYTAGSEIDVQVLLTANHLGFFKYSLCVLKDPNAPELDENCFVPLTFSDGSAKYNVQQRDKQVYNKIKLPKTISCDRCVLRWHYTAGNNWGVCENGTSALGCGPQETFRSCSDIRIVNVY
jgi:hypothetical protein